MTCVVVLASHLAAWEQDPPSPVFRSSLQLIEVEAIVRDADGNPVDDLTQAEFEVLEDGVAQPIQSFARLGAEHGGASLAATNASAVDSGVGRHYVLVLDSGDPARVRAIAQQFLDSSIGAKDAVTIIHNGGAVPDSLSFSSDGERLRASVNRVTYLPSQSTVRSFRMLRDVAARLASVSGRRHAVIFIGTGTRLLWNEDPRLIEIAQETKRMFQQAMRTATLANIPVHAIDPSGDEVGAFPPMSGAVSGFIEDPILRLARMQAPSYREAQSSVRLIAELTGGVDVVNTRNWRGGFTRIVQDRGPSYLLTYSSPANQRDGRFHAIEVRLTRPDLRVQAKRGYYALPPGSTAPPLALPRNLSVRARDVLQGGATDTNAGITVSVAGLTDLPLSVLVTMHVDAAAVPLDVASPVEIVWAATDEDDLLRAVQRHEVQVRRGVSSFIAYGRLPVERGRYRIKAFAVQKHGTLGVATASVDTTLAPGEPGTFTDVVLATSGEASAHVVLEDKRLRRLLSGPPAASRKFSSADTLTALVDFIDRTSLRSRKLVLRATMTGADGVTVMRRESAVSQSTMVTVVSFSMTTPLASFPPGEYALRFEARAGENGDVAVFRETTFVIYNP